MNYELTNLNAVAREFLAAIGDRRVIAFYGKMGAGKTTFIKALCEELGITDTVTSPTFAIVNEYTVPVPTLLTPHSSLHTPQLTSVYHFDFYRIHRIEEVYDMGYEDYFYSGGLCLIEWPELIEDLLPDDTMRVVITENPDGTRSMSF